jgi:hypothetical protein
MPSNTFELTAKSGAANESTGWFAGRFLAMAPGAYEVRLAIPGTADVLSKRFVVKEFNAEMDNTMPDFTALRQLASPSELVATRVAEDVRQKLKSTLEASNRTASKDAAAEDLRLYFDLKSAELIPDLMVTDRKTVRNRGPVKDIWDAGFEVGGKEPPWKISTALLLIIGLLAMEWLTRKLLRLA